MDQGQEYPEQVTFEYNGNKVPMDRAGDPDEDTFLGYIFECPKCHYLTTLGKWKHKITVTDGRITVNPSLVCPHKRDWHVWLKDGVAVDC